MSIKVKMNEIWQFKSTTLDSDFSPGTLFYAFFSLQLHFRSPSVLEI